jgi:hypothetical protein
MPEQRLVERSVVRIQRAEAKERTGEDRVGKQKREGNRKGDRLQHTYRRIYLES